MANINVYELVKLVLDDTYDELGGTEDQRDARIVAALDQLRAGYKQLHSKPGPTYADPAVRFAYIFRYVSCHANLLCELLSHSWPRKLFAQDTFVASCLGGGPGSDVVGIIKRLLKMYDDDERTPRVQVYLCDREKRWLDSWGDVGTRLPNLNLFVTACDLDVTDPTSWDMTKYLKADLFTMMYFLSEVYALKDKATPFFRHVFSKAKPGALFAFIDNRSDHFSDWFDEMAKEAGLEILHDDECKRGMPGDEQQSVLNLYRSKFSGSTKLDADICERIARKI
jgi:hypothetical protein